MADMLNMSIENMTKASWLLFVISGALAVSAVILFFALNIPKCLRMVTGKHPVHSGKEQKISRIKKARTEKLSHMETFDGSGETLLLTHESEEQTELLDVKDMDMIQDIVYMQKTGNITSDL